jgi:hypothetical protein
MWFLSTSLPLGEFNELDDEGAVDHVVDGDAVRQED